MFNSKLDKFQPVFPTLTLQYVPLLLDLYEPAFLTLYSKFHFGPMKPHILYKYLIQLILCAAYHEKIQCIQVLC